MLAGAELEMLVLNQLKAEVIPMLNQQELSKLPIQMIDGLTELILKSNDSQILVPLLNTKFQKWFASFKEDLMRDRRKFKKQGNSTS
jgi:hypothetical protein